MRGLCFDKEIAELADKLPDFRYIPALSDPVPDGEWDGATGLITDVVQANESTLAGMDAYVCGPPPMVDAAIATLTALGVREECIFYDKFTTTGEPEDDGGP